MRKRVFRIHGGEAQRRSFKHGWPGIISKIFFQGFFRQRRRRCGTGLIKAASAFPHPTPGPRHCAGDGDFPRVRRQTHAVALCLAESPTAQKPEGKRRRGMFPATILSAGSLSWRYYMTTALGIGLRSFKWFAPSVPRRARPHELVFPLK